MFFSYCIEVYYDIYLLLWTKVIKLKFDIYNYKIYNDDLLKLYELCCMLQSLKFAKANGNSMQWFINGVINYWLIKIHLGHNVI